MGMYSVINLTRYEIHV